jgi:sec-independent protein translocase protein TatA
MPGFWEWVVIAVIGLLLFGKRLPEVGRSLGKGIVEFKKGLKGVEEEVNQAQVDPPSKAQAQLPPDVKLDAAPVRPVEQPAAQKPA